MSDDPHDKTEGCGVELNDCADCLRPKAMQPFCQTLHREFYRLRALARATKDADLHASILELLASMAADMAIEGTGSVTDAGKLLARITSDRYIELLEQGAIKMIDLPKGQDGIVH